MLKKIVILLAIPLLLYGVALVAAMILLDADKAKEQVALAAQQQYGLTLGSSGQSSSVFPSPAIYINSATFRNSEGADVIEVPSIKLDIGWLGLFSGTASNVEFIGPTIRLNTKQAKQFTTTNSTTASAELPSSYTFSNARLEILGDENGPTHLKEGLVISGMSAAYTTPSNGQAGQFESRFNWNEKPVTAAFSYLPSSGAVNGNLSAANLLNATFQGALSTEQATWQGKVDTATPDMLTLTHWLTRATKSQNSSQHAEQETKASYPLTFSADATLDNSSLTIHRSNAKFKGEDADFAAYLGWSNYISLALELAPQKVEADHFLRDFSTYLLPDSKKQFGSSQPIVVRPLPNYFNLVLMVNAQETIIGGKHYNNLDLAVELDEGNVNVHRAHMEMPGESSITIDGKLEQLPEGQRFYGRTSITGNHFNQWLANFEPLAVKLPEDDFSEFAFEGNLFVSKEQLRLSEADLQIGKLGFQGGFAAFFDQTPRVEAEIRLTDINLDYFRDIWRENENTAPSLIVEGGSRNFDWLRRLPAILDFNITIDGFTFLDAPGDIITTRLYSQPGQILLSNLDIRMKNNVIAGNVRFNVAQSTPLLDVVLTGSKFDTDYFLSKEDVKEKAQAETETKKEQIKERWSEELFDFGLLNIINGKFDITIGTINHRDTQYQNFKWLATLNDRTLNIKNLSFSLLGGTFNTSGTMIGGSVPGVSASFSLYNADLKELVNNIFGHDTISGRVSLSGVIGSSGINPRAWIEQGELKISAAARGVRIQDLNLQRAIDITKEARSTQDVKNGVKSSLFTGTTEISADGNINIQNGVVRTPGLRLTYGKALGSFKGEMDLLKWTLNLGSFWQFPELSSSTIPTMNISLQGDVDDYETRIDTSSLEAFVAKRIVGQ